MQGVLHSEAASAIGGARYRFGVDTVLAPLVVVVATIFYGSDFPSTIQQFLIGERIPAVERMIYLAFYAVTAAFCIRRAPALIRAVLQSPALLLLLALPLASIIWSVDRGETGQRLIAFAGTTLIALYMGATMSLQRVIILLGLGFAILAMMNLGAVALFPEARGTPGWPDSWRGFNFQKNALGRNSLIGALICGFAALETRGRLRVFMLAAVVVNIFLIANTSSRTTLGVLAVCASLVAVGLTMRRAPGLWLSFSVMAATAVAAVVTLLFITGMAETLLSEFGRNATLSGRIYIWEFAQRYIEKRPWLGYGYWVFWDPGSVRYALFAEEFYFEAIYAHSGYIEILLMTGILGLASFVMFVMVYIKNSFIIISRWPGERNIVLVMVFLILYLFANVTESRFFLYNDMPWVIFITFALSLSQMTRLASARGQPAGANARTAQAGL